MFGGGGVLGFAWIVGALTAIQHELGVEAGPADLTVGTSAGAVVAGLIGCGVDVDSICRHQLGMPLPEDPPISWNYEADSGGALPPRPGLRPGSPRLLWDGIRHHASVPPVVALSGLLPRGRGSLEPIHRMLDAVLAESSVDQRFTGDGSWPSRDTWVVATDYSKGNRVVFGRDGGPAAGLADAVCASCSIPAWYAPVEIAGAAYIDGGTTSNASVDIIDPLRYAEVFVLAPMAAVAPDSPRSPVAMVERRVRRAITRGIVQDVERLRSAGARVTLLTPGPDDLEAMGANLMNPRRRTDVLHTALRTSAMELKNQARNPPIGPQAGTA
ncbi:patatin-like phospholipase family protein [Jatrophihabitans sp. DSM 45814]